MDETGGERIGSASASSDDGFDRGVLENAPEAIIALDRTGVISYANPATERLLGYSPDDLIGRPGTELIPDRFHDDRSDDIRSYLGPDGTGVESIEGNGGTDAGTEETGSRRGGADVPLVHADGHEASVVISVREGAIGGDPVLVCVCRRPPDRRGIERRLRERKREIEALHGVATDLGECTTPDEVYDTVIRAVERILRFDFALVDAAVDGVLVPKAISSNLGGEGYYEETPIDAEDNVAAEAYRTGDSSVIDDLREHEAAPADSEFRSLLTVPIGDIGLFQSASKAVGAFDEHDLRAVELLAAHTRARLTQLDVERQLRRRTEELERQNERLEEFASIVSHDLRNPMNVAQGRLELARAACANVGDDAAEQFEAVENAHDRMAELIDDVLALAKRGASDVDPEPVSLRTVAEETWTTVETGDATLSVEDDGTVHADPTRLQQLIENLFRNSVEHGSTSSRTKSDDSVEHGSTSSRAEPGDSVEHGRSRDGDAVSRDDENSAEFSNHSTSSRTKSDDSVEHGSTSSRAEPGDSVEHGRSRDSDTVSRDDEHSAEGSNHTTAAESDAVLTVRVGGTTLRDGDTEGFYVEDDGHGLPEDADRIFETGFTTDEDGTGLGLAIVERIAEAHGWTIRATTGEDGGARFEFGTG